MMSSDTHREGEFSTRERAVARAFENWRQGRQPHTPGVLRLILMLALPLIAACGSGNLKVYPVSVRVVCDGAPASFATVVLYPDSADERLKKLLPIGRADSDGRVTFSTYNSGDGVPAGKFRATVTWHSLPPGQQLANVDDEEVREMPDRLAGKYSDPNTSGILLDIGFATRELPPIELSSQAAARPVR